MQTDNPLYNRLAKNIKKLSPWARENKFEAIRIYKKDIPEFPYLVDLYKNYCVIYEQGVYISDDDLTLQTKRLQNHEILSKSLVEILKIPTENIIWKLRQKDRGGKQYGKIDRHAIIETIQEGKLKFLVNLTQYLDTGLFLDHRPLRKMLTQHCSQQNILNLFCYTGSLSVAAAIGGATKVVSVDMSATYLNWATENFNLNKISSAQHQFIEVDIISWLGELKKEPIYDLILLDPPTFSNSKKMENDFEVEKDQKYLIDNCLKLLKPQGKIIFSTNKKTFKLDEEIKQNYHVKEISHLTIPKDFEGSRIHRSFEIKKPPHKGG